MKKQMCIVTLVCCLIVAMFPVTPARAMEDTTAMPNVGEEQAPENAGTTLGNSLLELLDTYFKTLLTVGIADYDDEELQQWLSNDTLEKLITRVENLSELEKVIHNVAFTVTSYNADTGELSADVTETVDGTPFTTTHKLQLSGNEDNGWRVESDEYTDAILYEFSGDIGAAAPAPPQTHPNTWKNTGNQATDIAEIALTQLGYQEAYAGQQGNYTKYNVWFYGDNEPAAWCAIFISWCANQAEIPTSIIKKNAAASYYSVANMQKNRYGAPAYAFGAKEAMRGDIAYIDNEDDGVSNHVGLVYNTDSNYIYTVEGNCTDKVITRKFSKKTGHIGTSKVNIVFFARPNYKSGGTPAPSTLSIKTGQTSYKITQGSECNVTGNITSNYPLTEVKATLGTWATSVPNLKGTSLDIGTSSINSFKSSELPVGTHTLKITATDSSGRTVSASVSIVVLPPAKMTFAPNPVRIEQGTSAAVTIQFQGENVGDLDISSIRQSSFVSFKEWREKDLQAGKATLILEGKSAGKQNFQIFLLNQGKERLISGGLDVEVYTLNDGIKERFDFASEAVFQKPIDVYRTPTDKEPYGQFSQPSCLCDRGAILDDGSMWLAMTSEYGGGWFPRKAALDYNPAIFIQPEPESLTMHIGETKTLSVQFGYMPHATAFHVSQYMHDDVILTIRKDHYERLPAESFGTANIELTVQANKIGAIDIRFILYDWDGEICSSMTYPVTVMPPDVPEEKYYYEPIKWAVEQNIVIHESQYFKPVDSCTRASAVMFLWRLSGSPKPTSMYNPFSDIAPGDNCYNAVLWAVESGITKGTSETKFSPDAYCNRGQIVTFLHRYAGTPPANSANPFKDVAPGRFCYDSVNWASAIGVTQGFSDNTFHPTEVCTRAQIVTFLHRYAYRYSIS